MGKERLKSSLLLPAWLLFDNMAVCPQVPQNSQLYGPHRNTGANKLQRALRKTYIFQDGEYNYTSKRLSKDVWQTSSGRDFSFGIIEGLNTLPTVENQLESHFEIHQSDPDFPVSTIQAQTTCGDYDKKISVRPYVFTEDKTVNWTDMSPRFTSRHHLGGTEYDFAYIMSHNYIPRRPRFPKINTCRMKLPPDASRFWVQRGTNFDLGSEKICSKSEQHSSFGETHKQRSDWLYRNDEDHLLNVSMRDQERSSYVMRDGDYNSILGDFDSTSYNEYGPRTLPHWILPRVPTFNAESKRIKRRYRRRRKKDALIPEEDSEEECENEDRSEDFSGREKTNELVKYARECTCPDIMSAGKNVEYDQKETHFQFGEDCNRPESMYDKDYVVAMHRTPQFYVTPSAGNLLQFDEDYSQLPVTSHCSDFSNIVTSSVPDKTSAQKNMDQQFCDNVRSSCNQGNSSTVDYQLSLSHEDYIPLSRSRTTNFKLHHNSTPASFLDTDGVLPHPVAKVNISEAASKFSGTFNDGNINADDLRARKCQCRSRVNDRMAHFVMGSVPEVTQSETRTQFDGKPCDENETLSAGKTEIIPPFTFTHLNVSENTEDLDGKGQKFPNTIMKCDYVPLEERGFSNSQEVINDKFDVLMMQPIAKSHLFHHDINNEKHLISTTMNDFTEPALMTGRKLLAAR